MSAATRPAVWQWSVEIPGPASPETDGLPRAFLWIPESCRRVRAVVVGQHNLEEEPILEHPAFRAALAELDFAAVWITPPLDLAFTDAASPDRLAATLAALSDVSGYDELARAFLVPIGHSAAAGFPWRLARIMPARTLAVISVSGEWPYAQDDHSPIERNPRLAGIPGLVTIGEYEWAAERAAVGLRHRAADATLPLTMLAEAGAGHFDVSEAKVAYLALYLRKAAQHRLSADATALRPIDPEVEGWLVDRWRHNELPRVPAAPVAEYAEPEDAFWCFDREHAVATEKFTAGERGKRVALLGYTQNGALLPQVPGTHEQVAIPFVPLEDGLTFRLGAAFVTTVPRGRPERWTGRKADTVIPAPDSPERIVIDRICGPVRRLSADIFAVRFQRMGLHNRKRTGEIWLAATHPGDAQFRRSVQQALLRIPLRHAEGAPQTIAFDAIPDQPASATSIPLRATSSAGARVHFYVREGPAYLADDETTLVLTPLPPRARRPIRITVVAWQWGRSLAPRLQSAAPVERSFLLRA